MDQKNRLTIQQKILTGIEKRHELKIIRHIQGLRYSLKIVMIDSRVHAEISSKSNQWAYFLQ